MDVTRGVIVPLIVEDRTWPSRSLITASLADYPIPRLDHNAGRLVALTP